MFCPAFFGRWGYTYSIFFDGNAFHGVGESISPSPPSLSINDSGCSTFSTTIDGVLTALENDTTWHGVTVSDVVSGGFTLTQEATADDVTDGLSVLPLVDSPMLTYRGVADDQEGNSWTMSFSSNEGAVSELVCVTEDGFVGYCEVRNTNAYFVSICCSRFATYTYWKRTTGTTQPTAVLLNNP